MMTDRLQNYSNLTQRIIAALIAVPIMIAGIFYSPYTFWILFLAISVLTQYEFYKLIGLNGNLPLSIYGTFCGALLNVLTFWIEKESLPFRYYYLIIPMLTVTFFIKLYRKSDVKPFENLGYTFLGIIYVAVPFALINELVFERDHYKPYLMMGVLVILWVNDSGAYFAGSVMGRRKLFERISPKKTWEGFIGGAVFSLLAAFVYAQFYEQLAVWKWLMVAAIIVITGTLGDLVESLFKRSIAIKDSGSVIPGHGGFLDRFDGLLLSMPFILTFLKIFI
jgi:phosphatidate cytidylyltransferase